MHGLNIIKCFLPEKGDPLWWFFKNILEQERVRLLNLTKFKRLDDANFYWGL